MIDEKDLKKIAEEVGRVIEDNVNPQFAELYGNFSNLQTTVDNLQTTVDNLQTTVDNLQTTVANLPDKAYLDDKLADLEGATVIRQRKEDKKLNLLINFLANKKILVENEVAQLNAFKIFPAPPDL